MRQMVLSEGDGQFKHQMILSKRIVPIDHIMYLLYLPNTFFNWCKINFR